ncbi:VOC family protein [Microbacterium sp. NPDC058389]|uniref:VOC family protein n=1 Tax=Microbacterium sp. NPDC058389 TaxID=3346475 RepID=UPI0036638728
MTAQNIEHIGILVENLEEAIERWSAALGYQFSPVARYRTQRWVDSSDRSPHFHDARISFSLQGPPRIELMEVSGNGTHSAAQLGIHHFGFPGHADPLASAAASGLAVDGQSLTGNGDTLLCFTEKAALDGIRLEFISPLPGPVVADDGRPLQRDALTGRADLWLPPLEDA